MNDELIALEYVAEINAHHREVLRAGDDMISNAISAGYKLGKAKEATPHGSWEGFVREMFPFSMRTTQCYIKAYNDLGEFPKAQRSALLAASTGLNSLTKAMTMAAKPPPDDPPAPPSPQPPSEGDEEPEFIEEDDEPCANCGGVEWVISEGSTDFDACRKCGHPWGEAAGDPDEGKDGWKIQKRKTIKTIQAAVRAVDALHDLKANTARRDEVVMALQDVEKHVEEW